MVSPFRITFIPILFIAISSVSAAPWPGTRINHDRHSTCRSRRINAGLTLESYNPKGNFKVRIFKRNSAVILLNPALS
jgi:hypothetical protein